MEPWLCPRCGTVWAGWVPKCKCKPNDSGSIAVTVRDNTITDYQDYKGLIFRQIIHRRMTAREAQIVTARACR